jgi:hypothetical protein
MFDLYLKERGTKEGKTYREFEHDADYLPYVDGKNRYKGV